MVIINQQSRNFGVDDRFNRLMKSLQKQSVDEIVTKIVLVYKSLLPANKKVLEDYFLKYDFWGTLNEKQTNYGVFENRARSMHDHSEDFLWLYDRLPDYRSRIVLYTMLNNWLYFSSMMPAKEIMYSQYFDLDVMRCGPEEVLVDVGAYYGETTEAFISNYGAGHYKKIYCYEITPAVFDIMQGRLAKYGNIVCRQMGLSDKEESYFISENTDVSANTLSSEGELEVHTTSLDIDVDEKVTLIKMDIEGFEYQALKGCDRHIRTEKPKLAIAVYHNNEDIWRLPRLIDGMNPGYSFHLRYHGQSLSPTEVTLLAT